MSAFRNFAKGTLAGRIMMMPWRLWCACRVTLKPVWSSVGWVFNSREHYNYTYNLHPVSIDYLVAMLAVVTGKSRSEIAGYIREIQTDEQLKRHVVEQTQRSPERYVADTEVRFGRRMGWYAAVRALKPKVVVETGVDKGLGSVVLVAALQRNTAEGSPGKHIGIDINPKAGYLLQAPYGQPSRMIYADSLATLAGLDEPVDLFIHDSDHSPEFEMKEYSAVTPKLSPNGVILSDNAAHTDELLKWASERDREFLYYGEKPIGHWWPGEGIGFAFQRNASGAQGSATKH